MNPDSIQLSNLSKSFEYVKFCKEVDDIEDIDNLKNLLKCYFKLYLKQQEVVSELALPQS